MPSPTTVIERTTPAAPPGTVPVTTRGTRTVGVTVAVPVSGMLVAVPVGGMLVAMTVAVPVVAMTVAVPVVAMTVAVPVVAMTVAVPVVAMTVAVPVPVTPAGGVPVSTVRMPADAVGVEAWAC